MSEDRDLDSVVTVSADGVSVEKRFEREAFAVPAVEFTVRSDREEPASVRLVDHVPEDFPMDSVGFHPDYENDNWTAYKDHRVEFERELAPGEEVVTVYGVRLSESDAIADFMADPDLADVIADSEEVAPDPLASVASESESPMDGNTITDIVSEEGNQVVRDVLAGDRDTLPGLGDEPDERDTGGTEPVEAGIDEPVEAGAEGSDPADSEATTADPRAEVGETESVEAGDGSSPAGDPLGESAVEATDESEPVVEPVDEDDGTPTEEAGETDEILTAEPDLPTTEGVASALAEEIREGSVSDGDLAVLRQGLDAALPESTNVRIRHLQSRVEDLAAYTGALEEFIDDQGTAETVLAKFETFEEEVDELNAELGALEAEVDDVRGFEDDRQAITDLQETVETVQADQSETADRVGALESELADVSEDIDGTREQIKDLHADREDIQAIESEIDSLREEMETIADLEGRLDSIEALRTDVAAVRTEFEELEELVGANTEDLTALETTLSNVESGLSGVSNVEGDLQSIDERLDTLSESVERTEESLESTVSDLQSDVESITEDVEEIRTWRDQLKGVFGAGGD